MNSLRFILIYLLTAVSAPADLYTLEVTGVKGESGKTNVSEISVHLADIRDAKFIFCVIRVKKSLGEIQNAVLKLVDEKRDLAEVILQSQEFQPTDSLFQFHVPRDLLERSTVTIIVRDKKDVCIHTVILKSFEVIKPAKPNPKP